MPKKTLPKLVVPKKASGPPIHDKMKGRGWVLYKSFGTTYPRWQPMDAGSFKMLIQHRDERVRHLPYFKPKWLPESVWKIQMKMDEANRGPRGFFDKIADFIAPWSNWVLSHRSEIAQAMLIMVSIAQPELIPILSPIFLYSNQMGDVVSDKKTLKEVFLENGKKIIEKVGGEVISYLQKKGQVKKGGKIGAGKRLVDIINVDNKKLLKPKSIPKSLIKLNERHAFKEMLKKMPKSAIEQWKGKQKVVTKGKHKVKGKGSDVFDNIKHVFSIKKSKTHKGGAPVYYTLAEIHNIHTHYYNLTMRMRHRLRELKTIYNLMTMNGKATNEEKEGFKKSIDKELAIYKEYDGLIHSIDRNYKHTQKGNRLHKRTVGDDRFKMLILDMNQPKWN